MFQDVINTEVSALPKNTVKAYRTLSSCKFTKEMLNTVKVRKPSGPWVIKLFSCSMEVSMDLKLLMNVKISGFKGNFMLNSPKSVINSAY